MKTVPNATELSRLAARMGASARVGARVVNAQGARMHVVADKPAEPVGDPQALETPADALIPTPTPALTQVPDLTPAIERMGLMLAGAINGLRPAPAPPALPVPNAPPVSWRFAIEHDSNGLMTRVRATGGEREIVFEVHRDDQQLVTHITSTEVHHADRIE